LSGTNGLSDVDGSAATPAIRGTDTNTGIFFPAADTIAFSEGGVESARFDSSGNLGLGVTPSAWSASFRAMQVGGRSVLYQDSGSATLLANNIYNDGTNRYIASAASSIYLQGSGAHQWYTAPSGTAGNAITFTQAMTLDASGQLAVGTSTPNASTTLTLNRAGFNQFFMQVGGTNRLSFYADTAVSAVDAQANPLAFYTNGAERARIDTSGNLLVGTTSLPASGPGAGASISPGIYLNTSKNGLVVKTLGSAASWECFAGVRNGNNGSVATWWYNESTLVGSISITSSSTSYNTSSDYRLKNTIAPMTGALAKVAQLKPCTYKWNADGSDGEGFIAHELAEVCPDAVTGEKDAVDEEGNPKYQGIDTSFLVATLTAAIQEQQALINAQQAALQTLTARVTALEGTQP
jgi:hypothetical protein